MPQEYPVSLVTVARMSTWSGWMELSVRARGPRKGCAPVSAAVANPVGLSSGWPWTSRASRKATREL